MKYFHHHYISLILRKPFDWYSTQISRFKARLWNISIGKNCRFYGIPIFRTLPNSIVSIGYGCIFNSSHSSNLIGVYSPCMISTIKRGASIVIGKNCGFSGTVIASAENITIGDNVKCGANTLITDSDWHNDDIRSGKNAPVIIRDNVWLGYGVRVLKGVHIGKNSMIGACSVVTEDIPENVIAAGNPCKVIKYINNVE